MESAQKNVEEFCVEDFINKVRIEREDDCDDCEYEVTKKAMEFYLQYPCYERWEAIFYGNSIGYYLRCPDPKHRKGYRGGKDYCGAYLLKEQDGEKVLTADTLTSITSPINSLLTIKLSKCGKDIRGEDIINIINQSCNDKRKYISFATLVGDNQCRIDDDIVPYIYAFAYVYHWCGNMMPVIWNPSVGTRDTIIYKVERIKEFFEKTQEDLVDFKKLKGQIMNRKGRSCWNLWKMWINLYWNEKEINDFWKSNYLFDVNLKEVDCFIDDKHIDLKWFLINTKLIIQRSYRIVFGVQKEFNEEQMRFIKKVFKRVFEEAQIPEEQWDLDLI